MRSKVLILTLSFVMVLCSSFSVFGATTREVTFCEPSTSDTQGYLAVMDSDENCNVFYWSIMPYSYSSEDKSGSFPSMNIILDDDYIQFNALCTGSARVTLTRVYNSSAQDICISRSFTTSTSYEHTTMSNIRYYCYAGNVGIVDDNISSTSNFLSMIWGDDTNYQNDFDNLISKLSDIDGMLSDLYSRLGVTNGYIDTLESKLSSIDSNLDGLSDLISSLDDTNSLLQDIENEIDYVEEYLGNISDSLLDIEDEIDYVEEYLSNIEDCLSDLLYRLEEIDEHILLVNKNLLLVNDNLLLVNDNLLQVNRNVIVSNQRLQNIINLLIEMQSAIGKEDTSSLDDSSISSLGKDEEDVLSDESSKLDDLSFKFGNAFDVVWDLISQAWQANSKVFTLVIMCLTIGLLKLILNR